MDELIKKLPFFASKTTMTTTTTAISEDTVAAILSVIYVTVVKSVEFAKSVLEKGGVQKLIDLSNEGQYSARVIKYASQILFCLWQHRELHDLYKKHGFKEEHFANRATKSGKIETLGRPVSNQGHENKHHQSYTSLVRPDWSEPNGKPSRDSINGGSDANSSRSSASTNDKSDQQKRQTATYNEVTYAQIHKNTANGTSKNKICVAPAVISGAPAGDSWV
uniref:Uncharacterized protein n=1 Tax=Romanomermis culicivorax TaxID=13658 RepID=A0A915HW02_ROMCU